MSNTLSTSNDSLSATYIYNNIAAQGEIQNDWPDVDLIQEEVSMLGQQALSHSGSQYNDYDYDAKTIFAISQEPNILVLFKKAVDQLRLATLEEQNAVKTLLGKEVFPEFKNPISKSPLSLVGSEPKVKSEINEVLFKTLYQKIDKLTKETKELRDKASTRIKLIAGATPNLNPNDPEYKSKKAESSNFFKDYEPLYNRAVDTLLIMKKKEEAIDNLQKLANNTIDGFTKENNILLKHLQDQFDILYSEHGFVDERIKNGYESTKSRVFGVVACVTLPEQKKPVKAEDLTQSRIDLSDDFSPFFLEINNYYDQLKKFGTKVQSHLNNVAGMRKAWNEKHPDFSEFKDRARLLPKEYEPLAKECNFVYEKLTHHNEKLEDLKSVLSKKLSDKMNQIRESKQLMIDTFKTYAEESQKLDRTMNGILTVCKDIRFLTAQTVEKYPISKEKEDQKEVKEATAL